MFFNFILFIKPIKYTQLTYAAYNLIHFPTSYIPFLKTSYLSHIENGTTKMSIDFMIALANTLEVSLDELFYDSLTVHKINDGYASILDGCSFEEKELISKIAIVIKEETEKFYK